MHALRPSAFPRPTIENKGFSLTELMIVVAIIATIASIALPQMVGARLTANEAAAISTLRLVSTAQEQLRTLGAIDTDSDGAGEFGFFAELAGTVPLRVVSPLGPQPGIPGIDDLTPSPLSAPLGVVNAQSLVSRSGYYFQIWLPGAPAGGVTPAVAELAFVGGGDPAAMPDSQTSETLWCAYAWPVAASRSGNRMFFVNQSGDLHQCANRAAVPFDGITHMPAFDEAYSVPGNMASQARVGTAGGNDGTVWTPVQ